MSKKHILISGGHSGIGLELTKMLLKEGDVQLGLVLRSEKRKASIPQELLDSPNIEFFYSDLSDQTSVQKLAQELLANWPKLDVLFNNAGVLLDQFYESRQGNEMHLEVNTLAPYKLSYSLLSLLQKAESAVIVNTVTDGLNRKKSLKLEAFDKEKPFSKLFGAYLESKFALTLLSQELLPLSPKIRIANVTPGPNKTPMTADSGMPIWLLPLRNLFFPKPTKGAKLLYQAAFDPAHKNVPYAYISGNKKANLRYQLSDSEKKYLLERIS